MTIVIIIFSCCCKSIIGQLAQLSEVNSICCKRFIPQRRKQIIFITIGITISTLIIQIISVARCKVIACTIVSRIIFLSTCCQVLVHWDRLVCKSSLSTILKYCTDRSIKEQFWSIQQFTLGMASSVVVISDHCKVIALYILGSRYILICICPLVISMAVQISIEFTCIFRCCSFGQRIFECMSLV